LRPAAHAVGNRQGRRTQLPQIAGMALDDGSIIFNPVEVSREEALGVLERAW
jgi:alcohol dehydrogenase